MKVAGGVAIALLALLLVLPLSSAGSGHYVPQAGDRFYYTETTFLNGGTGDYTGYTESTYLNGTVGVTAVLPNGTETASYSNAGTWSNNTGSSEPLESSGTFTFSAVTYHYVQGTDNQTGYTNPYVWFYMNNSLGTGATFYVLNTQMTVESTNTSYGLGSPATRYVATIAAQGSGSFARDDVYGQFTATYTWQSYFDPSTGYIVGYLYVEHDTNASGDGFTITDTLWVTSTTYPLTSAAAPASGGGGGVSDLLVVALVLIAVVIVVLVIAVAVRARRHRGPPLPRHSAGGSVAYAPAPGYAPPPIQLTPSQQPAVQQVVVRETVKVNCRYCGALIDSTATVCPVCGAPRT
jgi:hypothetical protein